MMQHPVQPFKGLSPRRAKHFTVWVGVELSLWPILQTLDCKIAYTTSLES